MSDKEAELKPCPLCGMKAEIQVYEFPYADEYRVRCVNMDCDMGYPDAWFKDIDELIKTWNTRFQTNIE